MPDERKGRGAMLVATVSVRGRNTVDHLGPHSGRSPPTLIAICSSGRLVRSCLVTCSDVVRPILLVLAWFLGPGILVRYGSGLVTLTTDRSRDHMRRKLTTTHVQHSTNGSAWVYEVQIQGFSLTWLVVHD